MGLMSVSEVAQKLEISEQWVRKLIKRKELKGTRVGSKLWVIDEADLDEYIKNQMPLLNSLAAQIPSDHHVSHAAHGMTALSFFSGAMGLDLGLEQAGIEVCLACDSDKTCRTTIQTNRPDIPVLDDICKYNAEELRSIAGFNPETGIDLIVGGPPCQAFSTAGARKGFADARGNVFLYYIELLLELRPRYIVLENVRGLLSATLVPSSVSSALPEPQRSLLSTKGGALLYIVERLRSGGYKVSFNLYNAANFGVPQIRERVVMLCNLEGPKIPYLMPTHAENGAFGLPVWRTLRDALEGLPTTPCDHLNFPEERLRFYRMLKAGQYWRDLPENLQPIAMGKSFYLGGGKTGFYRRLAWDKPSCTLVTTPTMPATDICHPDLDRPLSVQEYRRIQMFPDSWCICGNLAAQYKQIGNAVPVGLGHAIGKAVLAHNNGEYLTPPVGFPFSRYKITDDITWEEITRSKLSLGCGEQLIDLPEIQDAVMIHSKEEVCSKSA